MCPMLSSRPCCICHTLDAPCILSTSSEDSTVFQCVHSFCAASQCKLVCHTAELDAFAAPASSKQPPAAKGQPQRHASTAKQASPASPKATPAQLPAEPAPTPAPAAPGRPRSAMSSAASMQPAAMLADLRRSTPTPSPRRPQPEEDAAAAAGAGYWRDTEHGLEERLMQVGGLA